MLPDVVGFDKCFDYLIPAEMKDLIDVGSIVRVSLQNRSVKGFVLEIENKESEFALLPIKKFLSVGPPPEVVELCRFGAELYCGKLRSLLASAKPPINVTPSEVNFRSQVSQYTDIDISRLLRESSFPEAILPKLREALTGGLTYLEIPPLFLRSHVMLLICHLLRETHPETDKAAFTKSCLVLTAFRKDVRNLAVYLRKNNIEVAEMPGDWAKAASGVEIVLGSRQAVFAPVRNIGAVVVFDAHQEAYQEERTPTWKATRLAIERARTAGVACILISPIPGIGHDAPRISFPRPIAAGGWPRVQVIDRKQEDPRSGLYSPLLKPLTDARLQEEPEMPVVFIYNRKGRDRLLACGKCGEIVRCESCRGACETYVEVKEKAEKKKDDDGKASSRDPKGYLSCKLCGKKRPKVCAVCSATQLRTLHYGVDKVAEELSLLLGRSVDEITSDHPLGTTVGRVLIGTQAVLYAIHRASIVIFLDIDQDLLRPKYKSGEKVLSQLAAAAKLLAPRSLSYGGRDIKRRIVIQTRIADHPVIGAAVAGDPSLFWESEALLRKELNLPPYSALAHISGSGAPDVIGELRDKLEVGEYDRDAFLVRSKDEQELTLVLKQASLPKKNVKVTVDPDDV